MKKVLVIILVIIVLCGASIAIFWCSNIGAHPIDNIEALQLPIKSFPEGWQVQDVGSVPRSFDSGSESRRIEFGMKSEKEGIAQFVYRYNNVFASMFEWNIQKHDYVVIEDKYPYLEYQSKVANSWYFACDRNLIGGPMCDVLARYDNYIIHLIITVDKDALNPEELNTILRSMDDLMAEVLKK